LKKIDDTFCLGGEMRAARGSIRGASFLGEQRSSSNPGETDAAVAKKPATSHICRACGLNFRDGAFHGFFLRAQGRHRVSSRCKSTRLTMVHAAMSLGVALAGRFSSFVNFEKAIGA